MLGNVPKKPEAGQEERHNYLGRSGKGVDSNSNQELSTSVGRDGKYRKAVAVSHATTVPLVWHRR